MEPSSNETDATPILPQFPQLSGLFHSPNSHVNSRDGIVVGLHRIVSCMAAQTEHGVVTLSLSGQHDA